MYICDIFIISLEKEERKKEWREEICRAVGKDMNERRANKQKRKKFIRFEIRLNLTILIYKYFLYRKKRKKKKEISQERSLFVSKFELNLTIFTYIHTSCIEKEERKKEKRDLSDSKERV